MYYYNRNIQYNLYILVINKASSRVLWIFKISTLKQWWTFCVLFWCYRQLKKPQLHPGQGRSGSGVYPRNCVCKVGIQRRWDARSKHDTHSHTRSHLQGNLEALFHPLAWNSRTWRTNTENMHNSKLIVIRAQNRTTDRDVRRECYPLHQQGIPVKNSHHKYRHDVDGFYRWKKNSDSSVLWLH